jgi:hypothetical protein
MSRGVTATTSSAHTWCRSAAVVLTPFIRVCARRSNGMLQPLGEMSSAGT